MRSLLSVSCLALCLACSAPKSGATAASADASLAPLDATALPADASASADGGLTDVDPFHCFDGQVACHNASIAKVCQDGGWQVLKQCSPDTFCLDGACAKSGDCAAGKVLGCDGLTNQIVCSTDGKATIAQKCPGKQQCAAGQCRDVACTPYIPECTGKSTFHTCKPDGSGWDAGSDCKSGAYCLGGSCVSLCETNLKIASNVGCEYWSVDLDNDPSKPPLGGNPDGLTPEMVPHSVVISNPGIFDAKLTFTVQASCADGSVCQPSKTTCTAKSTVCATPVTPYPLSFPDTVVPAGQTREFKMPVMNVDGSSISRKAIHVQSTQPVVAFQFNPFDAEGAFSNDGSLLLPQNTLGKLYFGVALGSTPDIPQFPTLSQHGFVTVVAASAGTTTVQVTPTADTIANPKAGFAALKAGQTATFTLQPFDVLNLESAAGKTDLTGTRIQADKPVAVFAGHENTDVTDDIKKGDENFPTCCTEHLEEQLMPVETWGNVALCVKSKPRGYDRDEWIVVAGEAGVTLHTVPKIPELDGKTLATAGASLRVQTDESFQLQATGKIEVVQFLMGQGQTEEKIGDPTMMLVPPQKQYRNDYVIQTAAGFTKNWLTVVRPVGVAVQLDGNAIPSGQFQAFGDGTWEYAYALVQTGTHHLESAQAFGLMAYGYGGVTAYGYPGGMNLQ
jgi:hypothetical protein